MASNKWKKDDISNNFLHAVLKLISSYFRRLLISALSKLEEALAISN